MNTADVVRLGEELGLDAVGVARAEAYDETERHIVERRERGLFAEMKFTMAQPETSCHPETLLDGARTVVSAALCYWAPEEPIPPGHGRLARYTWTDAYAELRETLDTLGRRLGGAYRVLVDANQHVDREAAARSGVGFYGKNTMLITRRHGSWVVLGTLVTDVELDPTAPLDAGCGECRLCIDACPDRRSRRARHPRCDEVPLVLDAGARVDSRALPRSARGAGVRLRHLPGRLPVEPRRAQAARRMPPPARATSTSSSGSRPTASRSSTRTTGSTSRATNRAGCAETRSSRSATSAARSTSRCSLGWRRRATTSSASTRSGPSAASGCAYETAAPARVVDLGHPPRCGAVRAAPGVADRRHPVPRPSGRLGGDRSARRRRLAAVLAQPPRRRRPADAARDGVRLPDRLELRPPVRVRARNADPRAAADRDSGRSRAVRHARRRPHGCGGDPGRGLVRAASRRHGAAGISGSTSSSSRCSRAS